MAKDTEQFIEEFGKTFEGMFDAYASTKGVYSVINVNDLDKLGINSLKSTRLGTVQQYRVLNAFRRAGTRGGLLVLRDNSKNFRNSKVDAAANAFEEAGVSEGFFSKYDTMENIQDGMKKISKLVESGDITPEQFFKVATAVAYVSKTYSKSQAGIEYLTQFHEFAVPYFKGVAKLKRDGVPSLKDGYEEMFSTLGINTDRLARCIAGKELPDEIVYESATETKVDFNLSGFPAKKLTTNGMKRFSYAANQTYSLIVSEFLNERLKSRLTNPDSPVQFESIFSRLTDNQKEAMMPFLSIHGEQNFSEVASFLEDRATIIYGIVDQVVGTDSSFKDFSESLRTSIPSGISEGEQLTFVKSRLVEKVIEAGITTGAFATSNDTEFFYELSKGCAKSSELNAMFNPVKTTAPATPGGSVSIIPNPSYLYHEGEIYMYSKPILSKTVGPDKFEEIKSDITAEEESANGFVDLSEARLDNFVPNCPNTIVTVLNKLHAQEKCEELEAENREIELTKRNVNENAMPTGLYRSLPQYTSYVNTYQSYLQRFDIDVVSKAEILAVYNAEPVMVPTP